MKNHACLKMPLIFTLENLFSIKIVNTTDKVANNATVNFKYL